MSSPRLHALLDEALRLPPEYGDGLSSHMPMALHALHALGASDDQLRRFFDGYAQRFADERAASAAAPLTDWQAALGRFDSYGGLQAHFELALAEHGRDAVLRAALPVLLPGVAAAAFHGAIRTAHAVQSGHAGELAGALAYWAARWQALAPPRSGVPMFFDEWSAALLRQAAGWRSDLRLISLRMQAAEASEPYQALAGQLAPAQDTLARLSFWAAQLYRASGNFTVLHMVTGCHAMRVLSPWIDDQHTAMNHAVHAITAAFLASGVAPLSSAPHESVSTWAHLIDQALASDDDHVIKLVHACVEEARAYGEGPYLHVAARSLM